MVYLQRNFKDSTYNTGDPSVPPTESGIVVGLILSSVGVNRDDREARVAMAGYSCQSCFRGEKR